MPTYKWQLVNASANIPLADGVAGIHHPVTGFSFLFGGIFTQRLSALYRAHDSAPGDWTFLGNLPIEGRHTIQLSYDEDDQRIYGVGGDGMGSAYQPQIFSFDGTGGDPRVDAANVPGLDRCLQFSYWRAGCLYFGGGQRIAALSGAPQFLLPTYRWRRSTGAVELVHERPFYGCRGVYSGLARLDGKTMLVGGGSYEDGGWPRQHRNDVFAIRDADDGIELIAERLPDVLANRLWHNGFKFDGKPWIALGGDRTRGIGADGDLNDSHYSPDGGQTWVEGPLFPGTKRHAAAIIERPDDVLLLTGSHYGPDVWRLYKDPFNYGMPVNSATGWGAVYTAVDLSSPLAPDTTIDKLGLALQRPFGGLRTKIAREVLPGLYDFVYNAAHTWSHPGATAGQPFAYADDPVPVDYTIPNDGKRYLPALSSNLPGVPPEPFSSIGSRAMKEGDLSGNGVAMPVYPDGTICARWSML